MLIKFGVKDLERLWKPKQDSTGEENGQVVIIGGSELFTGAPLLSLMAASRLVDMVFLATPEMDRGAVERTALFSKLKSVIWIPKNELSKYIEKADATLIGPGMMRYRSENSNEKMGLDVAGTETRMLTQYLLSQYPDKKWVIDGGSLQVIEPSLLPAGTVVTPNKKEYELLFSEEFTLENLQSNAKKYSILICHKGPTGYVTDGETTYEIDGGNAGLTKGGTGDVLAGMTVGLLAKNEPLLATAAASYIVKKTAEYLYEKVGYNFNADDVAENCFEVFFQLIEK